MNKKEKQILKQHHYLILTGFINSKKKDIIIIPLLGLIILGYFTFGIFSLIEKSYLYSISSFIFFVLSFFLLRQIIKSNRIMHQEAFKTKNKFEEDFPELVDKDIVKLHSKIKKVNELNKFSFFKDLL